MKTFSYLGCRVVFAYEPRFDALVPDGARARFIQRPGRALRVMIRQHGVAELFVVVERYGVPTLLPQGRNVRR